MPSPPVPRKSPSRLNQKQIIAFVRPELAAAAHQRARKNRMTLREVIGEAINAAYVRTGRNPPFQLGHARIVRRTKARARIRPAGEQAPSRWGTRAVSGWFDAALVSDVAKYAAEQGHSMQSLIEWGLELLTGVSRHDPEETSEQDPPSEQAV